MTISCSWSLSVYIISVLVYLGLYALWINFLPGHQPMCIKDDPDLPGDSRPRIASPRADAVIGLSYSAIPFELAVLLFQIPSTSIPQKIVIGLFVCFILFCGIGHFLDAAGADVHYVLIDRYATATVSAVTALAAPIVLHVFAKTVIRTLHERKLLIKQRDQLTDAQAMSHLGNWELEIDGNQLVASDEWFRIFGIDPSAHIPSHNEAVVDVPLSLETESLTTTAGDALQTSENNRIPFSFYLSLLDSDEDRERVQQAIKETIQNKTTYYIEQKIRRHNDGELVYIRGFGKPVFDVYGNVIGLRGTAQDITKEVENSRMLTKAKEKALAESKHKDIFLATMSHELRTPLTSIIGHIDLMEETDLNEDQQEYLLNTRLAARSLLSQINDILDYSKLVAGTIQLDNQPTNLNKVLSDVSVIVQPFENSVHLSIEPYNGPMIITDYTRIRQIFVNLISNALKFTPSGGNVRVAVTWQYTDSLRQRCRITIIVEDNGIGMSPEVQSRLFTPFTQGDSTTSRRFGGTGLGLSIVKRIVNALNGDISVQSTEGKGSTFRVSFTADISANGVTQVEHRDPSLPSTTKLQRILLAEDNVITQNLVRKLLKDVPTLDIANDGNEALQCVIKNDPYDAFFCDINMPVMDGLTATREIRKTEKGKSLYIIGLTANAFQSDKDACLEAGMNDYVSKPFTKSTLMSALNRATLKIV